MNIFKWFLMLNKRLYKKVTFVVLMALIPLCVLILMFAAKQESGFVKVVLAQYDNSDPISSSIVSELMGEQSLILFAQADTPEKALAMVESGQADAAWIFPADLQQNIRDFSAEGSSQKPFVSVVEREQTVFTRLAREKLSSALFQYCARARYISYSLKNVSGLEGFSDDALMVYYDEINISRDLFAFDNEDENGTAQASYLIAPVRGLLSVLICLSGAAAALLYMQDEKKGMFALVKETQRPMVAFACLLIALLNISAVALVSLFVTGLTGGILTELLGIVMYAVCCALFCLLLKDLLCSIRLYSVILPLLAIAMCAICPVFFEFKGLGMATHLFPPTYYIHLLHDRRYLLYMPLYALALTALLFLVRMRHRISFTARHHK